MISPFSHHNLIENLIPIQILSSFFSKASLILLLILIQSLSFSSSLLSVAQTNLDSREFEGKNNTMKVHPLPKKRNITIQYDLNARNSQTLMGGTHKKLKRLPHIFSRVLELPFRSDADVSIEESPDCFKFIAETDDIVDARAHMIEIHPGVTKIVIRSNESLEFASLDQLGLDIWRFRLPESTQPELASAVYVDGELIVTVPKVAGMENLEEGGGGGVDGNGEFRGGMGNNRLVLVQ